MEIIKTCEQIHADTLEKYRALNKQWSKKANICIMRVGNDPASDAYVRGKMKDLEYVGIPYEVRNFSSDIDFDSFTRQLEAMNENARTTGIIVQLPLPEQLAVEFESGGEKVANYIRPHKDIDGFRLDSNYAPCTPLGIMMFLDANKISLDGKIVTIINRSDIVGKPLAQMMQDRNATVMVAHSYTDPGFLRDFMIPNSDIVVTAVGKPNFITHDDQLYGETLVFDVGINRDENGKMCGDCEKGLFDNNPTSYVTPVPKGVGLLTRAAFIANCMRSART